MAIEELDSELLETALLEDQVPSTALSQDNQHSLFEYKVVAWLFTLLVISVVKQ